MPTPTTALADAWRSFCRRLEEAGDTLLSSDEFPRDPADVAEGYRHLTRDLVYALQWHMEYRDPLFPKFHRYMDGTTNWGGPCVDFNYLRARVDPGHTYRVWGSLSGVRAISFSLAEGEMHLEQYGVFGQLGRHDLVTGPDGSFELLLAAKRPEQHTGNFLALDPRTDHLLVRAMFSDWNNDAVPRLRIERIGSAGEAPTRPTPEQITSQLDETARWIETSLPYWNRYSTSRIRDVADNQLRAPATTAGGAPAFQYCGGRFSLPDDDDALVVELPQTDAPYWSIHYYLEHWFEAPEFEHRSVSLTGHTAHADPDGMIRVVFAHTDPGVPNWIDTGGRRRGFVSARFTFLDRQVPTPATRVVKLADLRSVLPPDHPVTTHQQRVDAQRDRREGFARRFT